LGLGLRCRDLEILSNSQVLSPKLIRRSFAGLSPDVRRSFAGHSPVIRQSFAIHTLVIRW
jgi:hypothetical protein